MNLHTNTAIFEELISVTSINLNLPPSAVRRDYYLVMLLHNLSMSEFAESVVFKGGTSISKCYPGIINRFSEDIDLTYIPSSNSTNKTISKTLKNIEKAMVLNAFSEKLVDERNERNKSRLVWFEKDNIEESKVKIEIGSSIKPEPYSKKVLKSYIHEHLEMHGFFSDITEYDLKEFSLNVLNIERTFIDKIFAVKRHAICGSLPRKVRHIYDVVQMMKHDEIRKFLEDKSRLKEIIKITKETDLFYLTKRKNQPFYNSLELFCFHEWKHKFNDETKANYEKLNESILYSKEKQHVEEAVIVFNTINTLFMELGE